MKGVPKQVKPGIEEPLTPLDSNAFTNFHHLHKSRPNIQENARILTVYLKEYRNHTRFLKKFLRLDIPPELLCLAQAIHVRTVVCRAFFRIDGIIKVRLFPNENLWFVTIRGHGVVLGTKSRFEDEVCVSLPSSLCIS